MRTLGYRPRRAARRYGRRAASRYGARTRRDYNASQQSKTMVVTNSRTTNSANRVGGNGLNRLSVGKFRDLPTLWPDKFLCKMKYQDTVNTYLTVSSGSYIAVVNYRVNALYDPLLTTAAEQPLPGYNELANMYGYYRVHAAKITANIAPVSNGTLLGVAGFAKAGSSLAANSTYAALLQTTGNPFVVWGMCAPGGNPLNLETYVGMKKLAGSVVADTEDNYASAVNNIPNTQLFGYVAVGFPGAAASGITVTVVTEIEFWCEFYGRDFEYS